MSLGDVSKKEGVLHRTTNYRGAGRLVTALFSNVTGCRYFFYYEIEPGKAVEAYELLSEAKRIADETDMRLALQF